MVAILMTWGVSSVGITPDVVLVDFFPHLNSISNFFLPCFSVKKSFV